MLWLSESCHFMHLMQNRCTHSLKKNPNSPGEKNHYTLQVLEACHKEFYYFSSFNEQVDCAYCNFHRASLNNSVTFSVRSFHSGGSSLQWHRGRVPQSHSQENTHTHRQCAAPHPPTSPALSISLPINYTGKQNSATFLEVPIVFTHDAFFCLSPLHIDTYYIYCGGFFIVS